MVQRMDNVVIKFRRIFIEVSREIIQLSSLVGPGRPVGLQSATCKCGYCVDYELVVSTVKLPMFRSPLA